MNEEKDSKGISFDDAMSLILLYEKGLTNLDEKDLKELQSFCSEEMKRRVLKKNALLELLDKIND